MSVTPGQILVGKYRVERVLGQGGMGVVVQATHLQLDERVAVKFLLPEFAQQPEAAARFLREARAAVKIKSEHVARVIDVGTLETGAPYMVMEFLAGRDLSTLLEEKKTLPAEDAVEYLLQACEAIAEAHAAGIVHRDLKPANLFLTGRADGSAIVKVLDFGISKVTMSGDSGADMSLTKTSAMMGSPLYMSPEQMRSARDVDARSDIWSLGAILYELLTGDPPFVADSLPELCAKILQDEPRSIREKRPDVPAALDVAVLRCLKRRADDRFPSIAEFAIALAPFGPKRSRVSVERISKVMSQAGLSVSQLGIETALTEPPPGKGKGGGTIAAWGQTAPGGTGNQRVTLIATLASIAVLAGVAAFAWTRHTASAEPAAASASVATPSPAETFAPVKVPPEAPAVVATAAPAPTTAPSVVAAPAATPSAVSAPAAPFHAARRAVAKAPAPAAPAPAPPAPAPAAKPAAPPAAAAPASRASMFGDRK